MQARSILPPSDIAAIRSHLQHGVTLDFHPTPPPASHLSNSMSVKLHAAAVAARLEDYLRIGAVERLPASTPEPLHVQPLHVVIKDNKKPRVCIDLSRNMNDFIPRIPFHYESVDSAVDMSWPGCWYTKIDLSDCFLSFPLHPDIVPLFTFRFAEQYWRFTAMPFGLAPAPRICTNLLSPVSFALSRASILHSRYLDDFFIISPSQTQAQRDLHTACSIFAQFGLVVNASKTMLPTQRGTYLGIVIDSTTCTLSCTPERVKELLDLSHTFSSATSATKPQLLSLLGKLSFASQVLSGARPFLRSCIDLAHSNPYLHDIPLTPSFHSDLQYWTRVLSTWNGTCRWRDAPNPIVISTDASEHGFGIYIEQLPADLRLSSSLLHSGVAGLWRDHFLGPHQPDIGVLEFFALLYAAHLLAPRLRNRTLQIHCDNSSDVHIVNRQATRSSGILLLLRALYALAAQHNFNIRAIHRAGVDNIVADFLSRPLLHKFSFKQSLAPHLPLSHVSVLNSSLLRMVPLRQALASNSLELSHFSLPSHFASTLASPTRHINSASSASASSSATTLSSLSQSPNSALPASTTACSASTPH